ncbi:MAG: ABC transporter ATP-binding protein [Phycisphaerae bacterium]|nr:ABC transporter ATP-binding protein [Phycisphaerae bacterium]
MIEVQGLYKSFGAIKAVDGVSFTVKPGQIMAVLGPNGAGKTTTMKMLSCFLTPDKGTAKICGYDIIKNPLEVRKNLGYLPEHAAAYEEMTVASFLKFICDARQIKASKRKNAIDKMLETCSLTKVYHQPIGTLSKGYKRRLGLAHVLIHDPPVLILDEPTDGLDPNQKHDVRNLIISLKDKSIIISTHILEEVSAICDTCVIMDNGKVKASNTPQELIEKHGPTLEDVFRKVTCS